ncbi:MAG: P1 family peptidase [Candidatus Promineifilaceae bacterium]
MTRARDLGIPFTGDPGPLNAITDVSGTLVGHSTIISGSGSLTVGEGPVRTGVTAILPRGRDNSPVFAGWYSLNGNGEMTGTTWIEESGFLQGPIAITNTTSVGTVRDAIIKYSLQQLPDNFELVNHWFLPVVAETYDGFLNDINGFHIKSEHVYKALDSASSGIPQEGNVGGGTAMICHDFKGGIGSSSRIFTIDDRPYVVGALVQANHGQRKHLSISGVPVGLEIMDLMPKSNERAGSIMGSSIIVVIGTDVPLLPHQLKRLARRVPLGIGKVGGLGENGSGDIFLAYSTANRGAAAKQRIQEVNMLPNNQMDVVFEAVVFSVEEAIVNALVAADTMEGINNHKVFALPHDRLLQILTKYNRFASV